MSYTLGIKGKLYRSNTLLTNTTWSSTGWVEITTVADVEVALDKDEADATTRGNNGWEQSVGVRKKGELTFELVYDPDDVGYQKVRDAYLNDTELAMAVLDILANNSGCEGFVSNFNVLKFGRAEKKDDVMRVPVSVKPSSFTFWKPKT